MDIGIISKRYAKALMQYAKASGKEEDIYQAVCRLWGSLRQVPALREALDNPITTREEKYALLCAATQKGKRKVSAEMSNFISLVLKNGRESILMYICGSFVNLYRKSRHIGRARLTTATPLTPAMEERIRRGASAYLHANMELETEVNPDIQGGFIFDVNDYRLDASIATQLKKVKAQFIDKNRRIV